MAFGAAKSTATRGTVDVHIGRLRKAINSGTGIDLIRTVRGFGYSLSEKPFLHNGESQD